MTVLEAEVRALQRKLARRDNEILRQERELHKLRVRETEIQSSTFLLLCCDGAPAVSIDLKLSSKHIPGSHRYRTTDRTKQSQLKKLCKLCSDLCCMCRACYSRPAV